MKNIIALAFCVFLLGCAALPDLEEAQLSLHRASFSQLPAWQNSAELEGAVQAFSRSCTRIMRKSPTQGLSTSDPRFGTYADWQSVCRAFSELEGASDAQIRRFFETHFKPWAVRADGRYEEGLFTGYYEAGLRGAKTRYGSYKYPLHARPDDLVMVDLGRFRDDLKGRRIAGRVQGGTLTPYEDRSEIIADDWPHAGDGHVLVWVDNPVDAFFVQIQGSGVVELDDGSVMRIGYAGQNGHPYYAIGRELVARGYLAREEVSMQSIRSWLSANPAQADEIMNTNKSYVFFRALKGDGPLGGEGIALTPGHSLAVDRSKMPYGLPLWVDIKGNEKTKPLQRLMIAQDTGGAIRGPVRGDVFWGYGAQAEQAAGHMNAKGRYWILLPREIRPSE